MSLQEKLDAQKKELESAAPQSLVEVMHRATEDLKHSGAAEKAKTEGDTAPAFTLNNSQGQSVSLEEGLSKGHVVLGFYRGRW